MCLDEELGTRKRRTKCRYADIDWMTCSLLPPVTYLRSHFLDIRQCHVWLTPKEMVIGWSDWLNIHLRRFVKVRSIYYTTLVICNLRYPRVHVNVPHGVKHPRISIQPIKYRRHLKYNYITMKIYIKDAYIAFKP